ncbi:MAG: MBL fold metallo-hydrolase, partial [Eggerthellaceae bacterium]|nr:MBL fold metallo-hydrolase [Eggerthellaceae bacterium]
EEACRLGRVQSIAADFHLPVPTISCIGYRLPDYCYTGSGDLFLYALHSEGHVLFVDCGPMNMTDHVWFSQTIERHTEDAGNAELFLTHYHFDHMGDSLWFTRQGISCYASSDSKRLADIDVEEYTVLVGGRRQTPIQQVEEYAKFQCDLLSSNPEIIHVPERTAIDCGGWHFRTMPLPGHAIGHTGLITEDEYLLFAGDCLGSRPPIFAFGLDGHDGAAAIECWRHLKALPLEWVIPAHGEPIEGEESIQKELSRQIDAVGAKAKRVLEELRQMSGFMTPCEFVVERKGESAIVEAAALGKYLNALNVHHHLAFLEFLYDYEQVRRRVDDDGAVVYEPARFNSFFA